MVDSRSVVWRAEDGLQYFRWINTIVVNPAESLSLSLLFIFKLAFQGQNVCFMGPEDGGEVCAAGSMWRVMMLLTHCQLGANQSINQSIVI